MKLVYMRCPEHGFAAISIDDETGCGTRVTPDKCCGSWRNVKDWALDASDWRELAELAEAAALSADTRGERKTDGE